MNFHDFEGVFEVFGPKSYDIRVISTQLSARAFLRNRGAIIKGPEGFLPDFWVRDPQKSMNLTRH